MTPSGRLTFASIPISEFRFGFYTFRWIDWILQ